MAGLKKVNVGEEFNKASAEVDAEEMRTLDPNTPSEDEEGVVRDVPLLAGYVDKDVVLHSTFSYREMNGKDEEAISKNDVRQNGAKLVNVICERCVVAVGTLEKKDHRSDWGSIIRSMLGGDLDYMAFKIRELSKGNEVEFTHTCPYCGTKLVSLVDTSEFGIKEFKGQSEIAFSLHRGYKDHNGFHTDGIFRLPNGDDREAIVPIFRKNPSTAITNLIARCMSFNDGTFVQAKNVAEMTLKDRKVLEDILKDNAFGLDTTIEGITCESCGRDISGEIAQTDFF